MKRTDKEIKEELCKVMSRIEYLKDSFIELDEHEELELRNLEVKMRGLWSELKDDF